MKTALSQLPAGWREIWRADLQKNKKQALAVNGLALGLAAAMLAPFLYGVFQAPFFGRRPFSRYPVFGHAGRPSGLYSPARAGARAVHEIFRRKKGALRLCRGCMPGRAAKQYFGRRSYAVIALAPLAFWGPGAGRPVRRSSRRSGSGCFIWCRWRMSPARRATSISPGRPLRMPAERAGSGYRHRRWPFMPRRRPPEAGRRSCLALFPL